ncbi:MAG: SDR family NAD(P)-dependent oxidoreductase [Actinobacteria bacterium]|nr:SDR family NAD(P)-dependent oxidoreductase [Actinomycetota bacterium]
MEMRDFNGKIVVVTGAASGIGRELARSFAGRGAKLALVDSDGEGLGKLREELEARGNDIYTWVVDVSVAEEVEDLCAQVYEKMGRVDVLCNNAGVAVGGWMEDVSIDDWMWQLGPNFWGVIYGCHYFYPRMIAQGGGGHIVNTASGAGLVPLPLTVAYNTTKFAVVGFSETLRAEAAQHGIGVSAVCPGFVATNVVRNARIVSGTERSSPEELRQRIERFFVRRNYTPDRVAAAVVKGVERNRSIIVMGPETRLGDFSMRLSRGLVVFVMERAARLIKRFV